MRELPRRRFLAGLGATAAAPAAHRLALPARRQPTGAPFTWGVASFDPTTDSVLLWTRVAPPADGGPVALAWRVATDEGLADVVAEGEAIATSEADHCVRVQVDDLADGRRWWFAFTTPDGSTSATGRTRTLPRDPDRLRLGVAACARYADGGYAAYRALAERDVDLVLHVGDYIYEDGFSGARDQEPSHRCTTLADYRTRYAQHRSDPDLQALHARHPMVAVWDDHDIAGNAWRDGARQHDAADGPWIDRLRAASQAHDEWLPGRTGWGEDGRLRAWRSIELGALAELVVLDTRVWGRDRQPTTDAELVEPETGPARSMLGADQAAFVADRLGRDDRSRWAFVANQVMLHPLELPAGGGSTLDQVRDAGFLMNERGMAINPDQWDGYPRARADLVHAIGGRGGVVVLTGDVHSSWAWEGPANDGGDATNVELVTPSITSSTFAERIPVSPTLVEVGLQTIDRDLSHIELSRHGYLLVDCTHERVQGEWWYVDLATGVQELGAARSTEPGPPMRLREAEEPTADRAEGFEANAREEDEGDDDPPWGTVGLGAAAAAAAAGLAIALRTRRRDG